MNTLTKAEQEKLIQNFLENAKTSNIELPITEDVFNVFKEKMEKDGLLDNPIKKEGFDAFKKLLERSGAILTPPILAQCEDPNEPYIFNGPLAFKKSKIKTHFKILSAENYEDLKKEVDNYIANTNHELLEIKHYPHEGFYSAFIRLSQPTLEDFAKNLVSAYDGNDVSVSYETNESDNTIKISIKKKDK